MIRDLCIFGGTMYTIFAVFKNGSNQLQKPFDLFRTSLQRNSFVFHYTLNPYGYLILGNTEDIGGFAGFFFRQTGNIVFFRRS